MQRFSLIKPHTGEEKTDIREQLFRLQVEQLEHDEEFHKEICRLTVHQRINHMALHFAKYAGRLIEAEKIKNREQLAQTIVDVFIISMVAANIFNLKLSEQFSETSVEKLETLDELGASLLKECSFNNYSTRAFIENLTVATGLLAKACESIDHLEAFPYREEINKNVTKIYKLSIVAASNEKIFLPEATRARLDAIKRKSIFYGKR